MSMGIGHHYLVHVLKFKFGTFDECFEFMKENKPTDDKSWFELDPLPDLKKNTCNYFRCSLVEIKSPRELRNEKV